MDGGTGFAKAWLLGREVIAVGAVLARIPRPDYIVPDNGSPAQGGGRYTQRAVSAPWPGESVPLIRAWRAFRLVCDPVSFPTAESSRCETSSRKRAPSGLRAKTHLARLLDEVAQGETITITKHGVPVAMLVPRLGDTARCRRGDRGLGTLSARAEYSAGWARPLREMIEEGRRW